jgi:hypothetical protein
MVVNLTSVSTKFEFDKYSCPGLDKHGNCVEIPVIHILRNEAFTDVDLYAGCGNRSRII